MSRYEYTPEEKAEIERVIRKGFPPATPLRRVSLADDFGGIDAEYVVNQVCPIALRVRRNRPAYAADSDITFRHTEPGKIGRGTYAPLAIFLWINGLHAVAGWMVDVYGMEEQLRPPLSKRGCTDNGDGTGFLVVGIDELHNAHALLRRWDGDTWSTQCLGGAVRVQQILMGYKRRA